MADRLWVVGKSSYNLVKWRVGGVLAGKKKVLLCVINSSYS